MGQDVETTQFTREDRQRYREKVRRCLDVFARMLAESRFDVERPQHGPRDRAQPRRRRPATRRCATPRCSARSPTPTSRPSWASSTSRSTSRRAGSTGDGLRRARADDPRTASTTPTTGRNETGTHVVMIGILPTLTARAPDRATRSRANPRYALLNEQIFAARGEDLHIDIDGVERLSTHADTIAPEAACTSVQFHLQVSPETFAALLERRPGHRRRAAGARRELAVLLRQGAVARDPHRAVRAGHRHPLGGAEGAGRAAAGVVRRALDHLDLRPVRGERPLLPGAAADLRRRGPGRGARARRRAAAGRAAAAQRHDLPLEPAGLRRRATAGRTCGWRTGCCRPGRRSSTSWPTPRFYYGLVRVLAEDERPVWSQMSFAAAEENFHAGARHGIDARSLLAGRRRGAGDRAGAAPAAADGARRAASGGASTPPTATGCSASSRSAA